ncbi:MAG: hypothetical protein LBM97_01215 [Candidatus Nomurabacteria bacterium]|jgi:hypothetical protein|nr:hypothetical protein [Candidatus Nomurabacteria bacterium]
MPDANSTSFDQTVQLTIPLREKIVTFAPKNPSGGNGSLDNPYITKSSNLPLIVTVAGPGIITITDREGNVVYTFTKTTATTDTFDFSSVLSHGIGNYEFTATFTDSSDPNTIYDVVSIYVDYQATTIIGPDAPNAGVIYIGDHAFLAHDFVIIFAAILIATFLVCLSIHNYKNRPKPNKK